MPENALDKMKEYGDDPTFSTNEYVQYAIEIEHTLHKMQKDLSNTLDPRQAVMGILKVAIDFYGADWCGILDVDTEVGVWTPFWWVNREYGEMARTNFNEFELSEGYSRWIKSLQDHEPIIVHETETIKEEYPTEYALYKRLEATSVIAVPFWKGHKGFLVLRNPCRYKNNISMLRMLNFAVVSLLNEYYLREGHKLTIISPRITKNTDVYISLLGELKITTKKGMLTENELKSPKIARLLVYLLLSRKIACSPREIADNLWPDEDTENNVKNLKSLIYRSQKAFQLISDYRLIISTANGYQLNPELNIITDFQLFDKKWEIAAKAVDLDEKIDFLKKAADLYQGTLFRTARHEHWLMATAVSFEMRYMGIVGELMKCLNIIHDYVGIQQYAAKALHISPHNVDAYFWIIVAMHKLSHSELAKGELSMARCNLLPEEFEELVKRLEEQVMTVLHS